MAGLYETSDYGSMSAGPSAVGGVMNAVPPGVYEEEMEEAYDMNYDLMDEDEGEEGEYDVSLEEEIEEGNRYGVNRQRCIGKFEEDIETINYFVEMEKEKLLKGTPDVVVEDDEEDNEIALGAEASNFNLLRNSASVFIQAVYTVIIDANFFSQEVYHQTNDDFLFTHLEPRVLKELAWSRYNQITGKSDYNAIIYSAPIWFNKLTENEQNAVKNEEELYGIRWSEGDASWMFLKETLEEIIFNARAIYATGYWTCLLLNALLHRYELQCSVINLETVYSMPSLAILDRGRFRPVNHPPHGAPGKCPSVNVREIEWYLSKYNLLYNF